MIQQTPSDLSEGVRCYIGLYSGVESNEVCGGISKAILFAAVEGGISDRAHYFMDEVRIVGKAVSVLGGL